MSKKILVTGATGNLGRAVVKALRAKGFDVKAASREPGKIQAEPGIEPVRLSYDIPATFDAALDGVGALFLIALPMDPEAPARLKPIIDRAKAAGVEHIVFNSALGVDLDEKAPLRVVERYLMESGMKYTILRPNFFMENFSTGFIGPMIKQGGIFLAADDGKTSFISVKDIAEVAAVSLARKDYGKEYNLTGMEAIDHDEAARTIGQAASRPVSYHALTEDQMLAGARQNGMSEGEVQYLGLLYSLVRAGYMASITGDVEQVTGRKPVGFAEFAAGAVECWK